MRKLSVLKLFSIVFAIMFIGGIIWSMINGYRYFCEGLQACDQSGEILKWDMFLKRKLYSLLIAGVSSAFITFMLVKDKEKEGKGSD